VVCYPEEIIGRKGTKNKIINEFGYTYMVAIEITCETTFWKIKGETDLQY
jgi:hypothetical protein